MIDWQQLWGTVISVGFVTAIIGYLGKQLIQMLLDVAEKRYQNGLERDLELHRHHLSRLSHEHSVRFSALHAEQAAVIKTLYGHLSRLASRLDEFAAFIGSGEQPELLKAIAGELGDLWRIYPPNKILLPKAICDQVQEFQDQSSYALGMMMGTNSRLYIHKNLDSPLPPELEQQMLADVVAGREKLAALMEALETEFRRLLGNS